MSTSEAAARISGTRFDDTEYKKKKNEVARRLGWKTLPFPEVEIEAENALLLPMIDQLVSEVIADVAAIAEVSATEANGLISRSLARIHFAAQDAKPA